MTKHTASNVLNRELLAWKHILKVSGFFCRNVVYNVSPIGSIYIGISVNKKAAETVKYEKIKKLLGKTNISKNAINVSV